MKYVIVSDPVKLVHPATKQPLETLADSTWFLNNHVLHSPLIGKGIEGLRRVQKLEAKFASVVPGDVVGIEDADYKIIVDILDATVWDIPRLGVQALPYFEAWEAADKQDDEWKRKQNIKAVE